MTKAPINEIKAKLKIMYPNYKFDIKCSPSIKTYLITAYKNGKNLSTLSILAETPMNEFWERIQNWMKPILSYYRG